MAAHGVLLARACLAVTLCFASAVPASPALPAAAKQPRRTIKVGLILPSEGGRSFERCAAATTMAIEKAREDGYLTETDVQFIWRDGGNCDGKQALGVTVELRDRHDVDVYVGIPCSHAAINAGMLISYWNMPHFSFSTLNSEMANDRIYSTLIRLLSPHNRFASFLIELFDYFNWNLAMAVTSPTHQGYCREIVEAMNKYSGNDSFILTKWYDARQYSSNEQIDSWLRRIRREARVVFLCGEDDFLRRFMLKAHAQGMTGGEYVFINAELMPASNLLQRWKTGAPDDALAKTAFLPLLQVSLAFMIEKEARHFLQILPYRMAEPPWNYNGTLQKNLTGSPFALFLYDAVYLYAFVIDGMLKQGLDIRNGSNVFDISKRKTFEGISGTVKFDKTGDRISDYSVWQIRKDSDQYTSFMAIHMTQESGKRINVLEKRDWGLPKLQIPRDSPVCGFYAELCIERTSVSNIIITLIVIVVGLLGSIGVVIACLYKRRLLQHHLDLMLWKISYTDIEMYHKKDASGHTVGSALSLDGARITDQHLMAGYYQGNLVVVKLLQPREALLSKREHLELRTMRSLNHENLNSFFGLTFDMPNTYTVTKFCSRGSLQDVLQTSNVKLDINFKWSFVGDLVQGMDYLHRSLIRSHGRLSSRNCVVDGRWVLRITDFGLSGFRHHSYESDEDHFKAKYWTAPELLRDGYLCINGTQQGDVYSFAIVLCEILFRVQPYEGAPMVPKDIIGRVRNGETPPFRPIIPEVSNEILEITEIARHCWLEDPIARPTFAALKNKISQISKGTCFNIMDNMLQKMEQYANSLEDIVGERTKELTEEKKKTDMLLYRMLPPGVADSLKTGRVVKPELFSVVSVYFSDVVAFTDLAHTATPLQTVDFLNDLWTLFDDIIGTFNVYKVETIGDAYMVASGVPLQNVKHATEIANMALDIISSCVSFKSRHDPRYKLQLRIGIHSGPVVAGVVGHVMPRYCLFGDTVNTASRLQSNSKALRIHISQQTYDELRRVDQSYIISKRGDIEMKGKGKMTTYWLLGKSGYTKPLPYTDDYVD